MVFFRSECLEQLVDAFLGSLWVECLEGIRMEADGKVGWRCGSTRWC